MATMPSMKDILSGGVANGLKNSKQQRILQNLRWRQAYQHSDHYIYHFRDHPLKLVQIPNGERKGLGTGTFVWPAAHILAKYLEQNGLLLAGKRVCELGAGVGLTGIITALLGAEVTLTDTEVILPLLVATVSDLSTQLPCKLAAHLQGVQVEAYDWNETPVFGHEGEHAFDVLIISDCVLPKLYPINLLVQAVKKLMSPHTKAYFSYEHRAYPEYDPRQEFIRLCNLVGLSVELIPQSAHHPDFQADDIEIWLVTCTPLPASPSSAPSTGSPPSPPAAASTLVVQTWGESPLKVLLNGQALSIEQDCSEGVGGIVWPSSVLLSRYLLSQPVGLQLAGCKAVDLGAGCGLTSLALQALGAQVIATDREVMMRLLQANFTGQTECFDWTSHAQEMPAALLDADLIVCSDCLYASSAVVPLLSTLSALCSSNGSSKQMTVLLANELRTALEEFLYLLRRLDGVAVEVKEIEVSQEDLTIMRTAEKLVIAPPIRMIMLKMSKTLAVAV